MAKKKEATESSRGTGHDCEEVHPDESHKDWKEREDEHDKNAASEGPHGQDGVPGEVAPDIARS